MNKKKRLIKLRIEKLRNLTNELYNIRTTIKEHVEVKQAIKKIPLRGCYSYMEELIEDIELDLNNLENDIIEELNKHE